MPSRRAFLAALGTGGLASLAGCSGSETVSGRWPRAGYDEGNTGYAPDARGPESTLTTKWTADVPDGIYESTPVINGDRVYVGYGTTNRTCDPGRVGIRVFDAGDGRTVEDVTVARYEGESTFDALYRDSVVFSDGAIYVQAFDGAYSLTPDGQERWRFSMGGGPVNTTLRSAHPVVADGTVYAPTASITRHADAEEALYAIDAADGSEVWRYVPSADGLGWTLPPAYADGIVYLSVLDHGVVALDAASGEVVWGSTLPVNGTPTVADGRVFVSLERPGGGDSHVVALDAANGEEIWRAKDGGSWLDRRVAVAHDRVYYRENLRDVVARDAATGTEAWRYDDAATVYPGHPSVTEDALYVGVATGGDDDTSLVVLDPATGEELGFGGLGLDTDLDASVVLADGVAFVTASLGRIYAFETCSLPVAGRCIF